jgi:hypothetical protein
MTDVMPLNANAAAVQLMAVIDGIRDWNVQRLVKLTDPPSLERFRQNLCPRPPLAELPTAPTLQRFNPHMTSDEAARHARRLEDQQLAYRAELKRKWGSDSFEVLSSLSIEALLEDAWEDLPEDLFASLNCTVIGTVPEPTAGRAHVVYRVAAAPTIDAVARLASFTQHGGEWLVQLPSDGYLKLAGIDAPMGYVLPFG